MNILLEEKQKQTGWDDEWDCYFLRSPRVKLRGITKLLKKRFYPRVAKVQVPRSANLKPFGRKLPKGRKGGKFVHAQLQVLVSLSRRGRLEDFYKLYARPDPRVVAVVKEVIARNWQIAQSEYIVGDRASRLGTAVDLLCLTPQMKIALLEIKTGYDQNYTLPQPKDPPEESQTKKKASLGPGKKRNRERLGRMRAPMDMLDRSPYSQHQLQLLVTAELFRRFTGFTAEIGEVWVVGTPRGDSSVAPVRIFPLHPELHGSGNLLLELLANTKK